MRRYSTSIFSFSRFSRTFLYLGWWSDDDKRKKNRKSKKIISVLTLFGREYNWSNSNTAPTSFKSHYFSFICTFVHINLAKFVWRLYNNKLLNGGWFLYFFLLLFRQIFVRSYYGTSCFYSLWMAICRKICVYVSWRKFVLHFIPWRTSSHFCFFFLFTCLLFSFYNCVRLSANPL